MYYRFVSKMNSFVKRLLKIFTWIATPIRYLINRPNLSISLYLGVLTIFVGLMSYQQQILQHSWNTISSHAPGNSGISTALEYLHNRGERLTDINLIPTVYARDEKNSEVHRASVANANLPNVDLSGSWLDDTDFSNSVLNNAILNNVRLNNAILDGANLTEANLEDATLENTRMLGTIAELLKGSMVKLIESTLKDAVFEGAILENSEISNTRVLNSDFSSANLDSAIVSGSYFVMVSFENASFKEAELLDTKFYDVNLSDADFTGAIGLDTVDWHRIWAWNDKHPIGLLPETEVAYYLPSCRDSDTVSSINRPANDCKVPEPSSANPNGDQ